MKQKFQNVFSGQFPEDRISLHPLNKLNVILLNRENSEFEDLQKF